MSKLCHHIHTCPSPQRCQLYQQVGDVTAILDQADELMQANEELLQQFQSTRPKTRVLHSNPISEEIERLKRDIEKIKLHQYDNVKGDHDCHGASVYPSAPHWSVQDQLDSSQDTISQVYPESTIDATRVEQPQRSPPFPQRPKPPTCGMEAHMEREKMRFLLQIEHLKSELNKRNALQECLVKQVKMLSIQLKELEGKARALLESLQATTNHLKEIESQKNKLENTLQKTESRLNEETNKSQETCQRYESEVTTLQQEIIGLTEENERLKLQCQDQYKRLKLLDKAIQKQKVMAVKDQEEKEILQDKVDQLIIKLKESQCEGQKLLGNLSVNELESKRAEDANKKLHQELLDTLHRLDVTMQEKESSQAKYSTEIEEIRTENSHLQEQLKESKASCLNYENVAKTIQETSLSWQNEAEASQAELELALQKIRKRDKQLESLKEMATAEIGSLRTELMNTVSLYEEKIHDLQMQLLDEQSLVETIRKQNAKVSNDHQKIGAELSRFLEDSEKLRRKYHKVKKCFKEKASAIEEDASESHVEQIEKLQHQLSAINRQQHDQKQTQEALFKSLSLEIDTLINKLGLSTKSPTFAIPATIEDPGTLTQSTMAIILVKLQWLQREAEQQHSERLYINNLLQDQRDINSALQLKVKAFLNDLSMDPP